MDSETPVEAGSGGARSNLRAAGTRSQRLLAVVAFVVIWMTAGWLLRLGPNRYLLLGVPLTILFQIFVRREPLRALWVRDAPPLRIDIPWLLITAVLAALPLYELYREAPQGDWVVIAWLLCAVVGAPAAAYALQHWNRRAVRSIRPAALIVLFFSALMILATLIAKKSAVLDELGTATMMFARWSLLYFTVGFLLEEVTFRGALDAHVYHPKDKRGSGSALLLSALWGLWHLPVVPVQEALLLTVVRLVFLHVAAGVPLSMSWRIGGNLAVPVAAHALLDGVRNAVQSFVSRLPG